LVLWKINTIDKSLARWSKKKRKKTQIRNRNKSGDVSDSMEILKGSKNALRTSLCHEEFLETQTYQETEYI
jgi:hypothetical protein